MADMLKTIDATASLAKRLAQFRSLVQVVNKDSTGAINDSRKYKYADIASILAEVNQHLSLCGLAIYHKTEYQDGHLYVVTKVVSTDDATHFETSIFPVTGSKPQEIGSSMTYARRYNLLVLLDLSTDDDDGSAGNAAAPVAKAGYVKPDYSQPAKNLTGPASEAQVGMLRKAFEKKAVSELELLDSGVIFTGNDDLDFSQVSKQQASDLICKIRTRQEAKFSTAAQMPPSLD